MKYSLIFTGGVVAEGTWPTDKREALAESIRKWRWVVRQYKTGRGKMINCGTSTCALCQLYFDKGCRGCPVRRQARDIECMNTPYGEYCRRPCLETARAEVAYLEAIYLKLYKEKAPR